MVRTLTGALSIPDTRTADSLINDEPKAPLQNSLTSDLQLPAAIVDTALWPDLPTTSSGTLEVRAKSGTGGKSGTNDEQSFALVYVYVAKTVELSQGSAHSHIRTRQTSES
jgi:hypothetical protein